MRIKEARSVYTGGNIWLFYGELSDGSYFLTDDYGCTLILDESPVNFDQSLYDEWQREHLIKELTDEDERIRFCNKLVDFLKDLSISDRGGMTDDEIRAYKKYFSLPL